jgi:hypothetical protein
MSNLTILGDTSGSVVLQAPAVAGATTLTLPATTGTVLTNTTSGTVLQVANANYTTSNSTTSTSYITAVTGTVTVKSATSNIVINAAFGWNTANANSLIKYDRTVGGSTTNLYTSASWVLRNNNAGLVDMIPYVLFVDTHGQAVGTTITYTISVNRGSGSGTIITNENFTARITMTEVAA